jgi:hypothetical protein
MPELTLVIGDVLDPPLSIDRVSDRMCSPSEQAPKRRLPSSNFSLVTTCDASGHNARALTTLNPGANLDPVLFPAQTLCSLFERVKAVMASPEPQRVQALLDCAVSRPEDRALGSFAGVLLDQAQCRQWFKLLVASRQNLDPVAKAIKDLMDIFGRLTMSARGQLLWAINEMRTTKHFDKVNSWICAALRFLSSKSCRGSAASASWA